LKYYSIDCIYCNSIVSLDVGLILKKNSNIPLILHVHESESYLNSYARSKNYLCDVDSFITVSGLCKNILIEKYGVSPDKVYIQYPFSPWVMNVIENNIEGISGEKKAELTIGTICNGTWPKAPELITLVADLFYKKFPHIKCKFMVVGISKESDTYYHIEYDLEKMHLQDKVTLAGQVNDPLDCYSQFDVLLLHSREESFSLVAEEAAVMGKPIVGFEGATGAAEWIKDECGILVPYMDLNALAEALYKLCSNDQLRMELGKNAKRKMVNIYKEEAQMKNVISALHSVVHLH
jgi:glycosyltransferase involved in cell wall biosynthesis